MDLLDLLGQQQPNTKHPRNIFLGDSQMPKILENEYFQRFWTPLFLSLRPSVPSLIAVSTNGAGSAEIEF